MREVRLVICDLDGTLIDTGTGPAALQYVCARIGPAQGKGKSMGSFVTLKSAELLEF